MNESKPTWQRLLEGEVLTSLINEPIDFAVDFTVEEPTHESPTERALRLWFKHETPPVS